MSRTDTRDLVVTENISLDGVIAPMDGWFDPDAIDDDMLAVLTEQRKAADALVLGRQTYQDFAGYWPASLVRSLLPTGLVDVIRLFVHPVVQGHGRRLFPDAMSADLTLVDTTTFASGVVLLAYRAN